jgi:hypothetical protein
MVLRGIIRPFRLVRRSMVVLSMPIFLAMSCAAALLLALASPALAAKTRLFQTAFGPDGTSASAFQQPGPLAVDQATGNVYVADVEAQTVQKFNTAHEPEAFAGLNPSIVAGKLTGFQFHGGFPFNEIAVSSTSHNLYVLGESRPIKAYQSDGEPATFTAGPGAGTNELAGTELCGVAVDSTGDIYASEASQVQIYAPSGEPLTTIPVAATCDLGVDTQGAVYLTVFHGAVEKYVPSEFPLTSSATYNNAGVVDPSSNSPRGVAVDLVTNNVFVNESTRIAEFDEAGTPFASFGTAEPDALAAAESVAVNGAAEQVYVSDGAGKRQVEIFGPAVLVPDVTTEAASNLSSAPGQATLNGTVNPEGVPVTSCQFEYGTTTAYGSTAPCSPAPGAATEPVSVSANVTGLTPGVLYHYRLVAANANPPNNGQDLTLTAPGAVVESQSASEVTAKSATLEAQINPNNALTTYQFEYGPTTGYGQSAPIPAGEIEASSPSTPVAEHIKDLLPDTTYHFRVTATALGTAVPGPDQTFHTQTTREQAGLPDGRAWELVSPPGKPAGQIQALNEVGVVQASPGGDAMTYLSTGPTEDEPPANSGEAQVLSTRRPDGWSSRDIGPPHNLSNAGAKLTQEYKAFSDDLTLGVVAPFGPFEPSLSPQASDQTVYLRTTYQKGSQPTWCEASCYRPVLTSKPGFANVPQGTPLPDNKELFVGATPDLSHVILQSSIGLTPGTGGGLYDWSAGTLKFVGESKPNGVTDNTGFHSISADGSRVVFNGGADGLGGLLMQDTVAGGTLQLDAAEATCPTQGEGACVSGGGKFQAASADGSKILFTDPNRLTADAGAQSGQSDLYMCDVLIVATHLQCNLTDLTPLGATQERAAVQGVAGMSPDGSWIYFVANGALAPSAAPASCGGGGSGICNLYVRHAGQTHFVAALSHEDAPDWEIQRTLHTSRVSPDGTWLAFMSQQPLTGYDSRDATSGHRDEEVYLYGAQAGTLVCASCNPTGARPHGREFKTITESSGGLAGGQEGIWKPGQWIAANVPVWTGYQQQRAAHQPRYLANAGRLFFNTSDALVAHDVNANEDVYQFEPAGTGGCRQDAPAYSERDGGCVDPISAGTSAEESAFLDASETGSDVFFLTSAALSSRDIDTALDVYDAHECTPASPCIPAPAAPPSSCASADSCKPAPTPQPNTIGPPASATFNGPGNLTPPTPVPVKPKTAAQLRAQRLAKALKACRTKHNKHKRKACEKQARKRYGPTKAKKASHTTTTHKGGK